VEKAKALLQTLAFAGGFVWFANVLELVRGALNTLQLRISFLQLAFSK